MKRTKWFPGTVKPVRPGWYEWKNCSAMRFWGDNKWRDSTFSVIASDRFRTYGLFYWRGLTEE